MQETNSYLYPRFEVLVKNKRLVPEDRQISRASIDTQHASMNKEERSKWMWMQAYTIATGFQKACCPSLTKAAKELIGIPMDNELGEEDGGNDQVR